MLKSKEAQMNILLSEHLLLLLSLNRLSIYLNDILKQGQFRTVIFYYENETAFVATHLINMISRNERIIFSYVTFNIDGDHSVSNINHNMGTVFFNICVFDNIISGKHLLNEEPYFHPRFHSVYISQQNATNQQISDFFESVWEYSVLNAGLIFWTGPVRIYTHFPYQKKFLVKLFESDGDGVQNKLPNSTFDALFERKADNLGNTTFNVFINTDPPKVFGTPGRFRIGPKYYFNGRDGVMARLLEQTLNVHWQYRTVPAHFRIFDFKNTLPTGPDFVPRDIYGKPVPSDGAKPPNVEVVNVMETDTFQIA